MTTNSPFDDAAPLMERLCQKLQKHPKRIVFPDGNDPRVLETAAKMVSLGVGIPVLLGDKSSIYTLAKEHGVDMQLISVIDPPFSSELDLFCSRIDKMARYRQKKLADPVGFMVQRHNFAAMMVQYGHADGIVAGNNSSPARVFRAAISMIKPRSGVEKIFGASVLETRHLASSSADGFLVMADCGVIPKPDVQDLATIAIESGKLAQHFLGRTPRIAMLSHSTKGSAGTKQAKKIAAATELAKSLATQQNLQLEIEGELQADVALDPAAAEIKLPQDSSPQSADAIVFPNLDAGHIALKLLEHLAGAPSYGQLILGLEKPIAQVPKTISPERLLGTAILIGAEAIKYNNLHLEQQIK